MRYLLMGVLILLAFVVCLILAKHGEEEEMLNEHEAIAKIQHTLEERDRISPEDAEEADPASEYGEEGSETNS